MRFGLILREVGQGFRRNFSMVVSVILVTFFSLTFVGAAVLLQSQIGQMKGYWYDRSQVAVYFCTDFDATESCNESAATPEQIEAVEAALEGETLGPYVERFEFEDHEEAYRNFAERFEGSDIVDVTEPEFLNQAFRINMVDPDQAEIVVDQVSGMPGVQGVEDERNYLEPIFAMMNAASITAVGIAALMLVAAVLLIATTIRLSAFSRRRELGIMRLVGASNRFIETPFVLEGVLAAFIGALLAGGATVAIVHFFVQGYLAVSLPQTGFITVEDAVLVVPILLAVGVVLAALSASFAIRRYLKV